MTHDEALRQVSALFEGHEAFVKREELRAHLKDCGDCRGHYDRVAVAMRRVLGNADEMTPEELWLFEPPLPAGQVVPLVRPGRAVGFAIAAMLAAFVIWYGTSSSRGDDFGMRGGPDVKVQPALRVVCMRGSTVVSGACSEGDTALFAVTPQGASHVKLFADGVLLGEGDVADAPGTPLPWSAPWSASTKFSAEFSCATCTTVSVTPTP